MNGDPRISVAVPLYNEADGVAELLGRVRPVLDALPGGPHEMVFVDDGSGDGTFEALRCAAADDERIVVISLSRNFGHQAALTAALDYTAGDVVVIMDGDLQDPPEVIPRFVAKYREGYDVVYATRVRRQEVWWLRAAYFLYYRLLARVSRLPLPLDAGDFSLISKRVVQQLRAAPERNRYLRGLRTWAGFRQAGIPVERAVRGAGRSKYTIGRLVTLGLDGILSFSIVPIRAASILGAVAILLTFAYAVYALAARLFFDQSPRGFTAIILVFTFMSGVQLLFLGIIGEYVGRIYDEAKGRPVYVVDRIVRRER